MRLKENGGLSSGVPELEQRGGAVTWPRLLNQERKERAKICGDKWGNISDSVHTGEHPRSARDSYRVELTTSPV